MNSITFNQICSQIPDDNLGALIGEVIQKSERTVLCKIYLGNVSNYFKGFRNINSVPNKMLCAKLKTDSKTNLQLAQALLSEWFKIKLNLITKVKEHLTNLEYKTTNPDFTSDCIEIKYLQDIHTLSIDDKLFAKIIDNNSLTENELIEITLAAILLGWYPFLNEQKQNQDIHDLDLNDCKTNSFDIFQLKDLNINKRIEKIKELKLQYLLIREQMLLELEGVTSNLNSGRICSLSDNYKLLNKEYNKIVNNIDYSCDKISQNILKELENYSLELTSEPFVYNKTEESLDKKIDSILKGYDKLLTRFNELLNDKMKNLSSSILNLDQDQKKLFEEKINNVIAKYIPVNMFDDFKFVLGECEQMGKKIDEEISSYDIKKALMKLNASCNYRAEKYILDFLNKNGTEIDQITFFLILLPSVNYISAQTKEYFLSLFIQYLCKIPQEDFYMYLSDNSIYEKMIETENGKIFIGLSSYFLFFMGDKERASARLYIDDVFTSLSVFKTLERLSDKILNKEDFDFYDSKSLKIFNIEQRLEHIFQKVGRYPDLLSGVETQYKNVFDVKILPILETNFAKIKKCEKDELENMFKKFSNSTYSEELYFKNKQDLHKNNREEKTIIQTIEVIIRDFMEYIQSKLFELPYQTHNYISLIDITNGLEDLFNNNHYLIPLKDKLLKQIKLYKRKELSIKVYDDDILQIKILEEIFNSKFYYLFCPEISIKANNSLLSEKDMFNQFSNNLKQFPEPMEVIRKLFDAKITKGLQLLSNYLNIEEKGKLNQFEKLILQDLNELEQKIINSGKIITTDYYLLKSQGRWNICKELLFNFKGEIQAELKKSSEAIANKLKYLSLYSAKLRVKVIEESAQYTEKVLDKLFEGLKIVDNISNSKMENKLLLAESILDELEHFKQFKDDSTDELNKLISEFEIEPTISGFEELEYLKMPLLDVLNNVSKDNYFEIGLTKKQWAEISSERKEQITGLIESWIFLSDKPTTKEDIFKNKLKLDEIENECKDIAISLSRICDLYITNDNKKIGQDPLFDWTYSNDLPFVYTTKIKSPRCSSLDKPIRFYIITQVQISSKKYINRIKDFITEKNYDQTGFNVIILLGNQGKFFEINTNSTTKNLPVLDESALKRIIFSTAEKKLPKWEFVSLLTLNNKISTIQPFKTQGSVDNNTGIFVGRKDIIREIVDSQKDFAIYGGRKIGKSSLLSVIRNSLIDNDYIVSYQSFQGIDNSLTIAKSIVEDLIMQGFKYNSLLKMENLGDFSQNLLTLFRENDSKKVALILDEMDELIHKEMELGRHQIIEIFRNISQKTGHLWRFVFAGYKEMYLEIHGKGIYKNENWKNPWQNFIDDSNKQLKEIESPRELIDEGLRDILGLEYDKDIIDAIAKYSTGHPAFLQKFCECLVKSIDNRISPKNRRVYMKDVDDVFEKDNEFIRFVKETLDLNLSHLQELITTIAAIEKKEIFTIEWLEGEINYYANLLELNINIDKEKMKLEIELLTITGVVQETKNQSEYKFTHPHYIVILKKLEQVDNTLIENLFKRL